MLLNETDLQKAKELKDFLEMNYQTSHDYDFLVQKFGMDKFRLQVAFKALTNESIQGFMSKVRVLQAMFLLKNTDDTVGSIAEKVGFSRNNLTNHIKKLTGKTPLQWRKNSFPCFKFYIHNPEE